MALEVTGEYTLPLQRETVWWHLNDPAFLQRCIPGCESFERLSENEFAVVTKLTVGPVSARFKGKVILQNIDAPRGYTLVGEGEGGLAGFAKGNAMVTLVEVAEGTHLSYRAEAQIGGKIAQLGQRLIAGAAKKIADRFFANCADALVYR